MLRVQSETFGVIEAGFDETLKKKINVILE